ncbi:MAG TPA: methyltransferase [Roseiarcus sp.]|jgi:tRNA1(Val) A37 N6-methylase TrmN6|nr:methyltransferase [Roseiarcus sp.]
MPDPSAELENAAADALTEDRWLGGRLMLTQPKRGHRVGTDAALLVAAAGDVRQGRIVDVGAGVGAVGLALAERNPLASVDLVEIDPELARLAESNAARNGLQARTRVLRLDALNSRERREAGLAEHASCVVTNPPFFDARAVRASPEEGKARAHVLAGADGSATLADWIHASLVMLTPGGRFVMIHRPDALGAILAGIGGRLGALALLPVHPTIGTTAHRLLVSGIKGSKAPLRLAAGLVLHGTDGRLTGEADAIHRAERLIDWGG